MDSQVSQPVIVTPRRWPLFLIGLLLFVLGPMIYVIEFNLHNLETPWQAPILATLGVALMGVSAWRYRGVLRIIGVVFFALLCGGEWFMLGIATKSPAYTGPAQPGQKLPAFITTRADGSPISSSDLENGQLTVLVFYRGHWCFICMTELGQLDEHHTEFEKRNVRVVAISNDNQEAAQKTQAKFKHLTVIADTDQTLAKAVDVLHAGMGPGGTDTNAPTTILLDGAGKVRWLFRPDRFVTRISADNLLAEIDKTLARK